MINALHTSKKDKSDIPGVSRKQDYEKKLRERIGNDLGLAKKEIIEYLAAGSSPSLSITLYQQSCMNLFQYLDTLTYNAVKDAYSKIGELDELIQITAVSSQDFEYVVQIIEKALSLLC